MYGNGTTRRRRPLRSSGRGAWHGLGARVRLVVSGPTTCSIHLGTSLPAIGPKELWARPSRGISSHHSSVRSWTVDHTTRRPSITIHAQHSTHVGPSSGGDGTGRNLSAQHVRPCRFVHALIATARLVSVVTAMPPPRPSHPASAAHGRHMDARALAPCRHVTPWCRPAGPWAVQASATCAQQRGRVRDCQRRSATGTLPSRPVARPLVLDSAAALPLAARRAGQSAESARPRATHRKCA